MKALSLQGVKNARDLGGTKTTDGRIVRSKKLLKSGKLEKATPADLHKLTQEYQVELIVDLRTKEERASSKDPQIKGVSSVWNPLFTEGLQGVTVFTPDEREILENHLKSLFIVSHRADETTEMAMDDVRRMVKEDGFEPEAYMARLYQKFINNQIVQKQVKQFFALLGNQRDGAVLWHCGAGKDRSAICCALLLYALGVSKEDIIDIYGQTEESSEDAVDFLLEKLFPSSVPGNSEYQAMARRIFGFKTCYIEAFFQAIEKDYVSIDNYLQKAMELHVDNIVRLKTLYLE